MSVFVKSEDDDTDLAGIPQIESNCISVEEFGKYTEEMHANSNRGFRDQYFVSLFATKSHNLWAGLGPPSSLRWLAFINHNK